VQGKSIADDKCRQVDPLSVSTPEFSGKYVPQEQYIAILNSLVTSQFLGKSNFPSILKLLKRLPQQKKKNHLPLVHVIKVICFLLLIMLQSRTVQWLRGKTSAPSAK
jgi:hypothetical protein